MVDERSSAMADQQAPADASDEPVRFASVATVKRTESVSPFAKEVDGAFYGLAFNQRSTDNLAAVGGLCLAAGGVGGAGVGIPADALAAPRLHGSVKLGSRWFELLGGRAG
jgi:hypothetical protein